MMMMILLLMMLLMIMMKKHIDNCIYSHELEKNIQKVHIFREHTELVEIACCFM